MLFHYIYTFVANFFESFKKVENAFFTSSSSTYDEAEYRRLLVLFCYWAVLELHRLWVALDCVVWDEHRYSTVHRWKVCKKSRTAKYEKRRRPPWATPCSRSWSHPLSPTTVISPTQTPDFDLFFSHHHSDSLIKFLLSPLIQLFTLSSFTNLIENRFARI